ncbi:MAG: urate oxidase [Chloroflexi bacterium]|nr:urate oxidase [Chloroflexota bacterium]
MKLETHYGKAEVSTYRTNATPLTGVRQIPESTFSGRPNILLAASIDVQVMGDIFVRAYTDGDNSDVMATDTMKNFIHRESLAFRGSTLEGWLHFLGIRFLDSYPQIERLRVSGEELRFDAQPVPSAGGSFEPSDTLYHRRHADHGVAMLEMGRAADGAAELTDLRAGRVGMELVKATGSSFAACARDAYTTLPERPDRMLFTFIDISWRYADATVAVLPDPAQYVDPQQVADLAAVVFHGFVSMSIQHLVHEIGLRMLERYPELVEITFEAQNRTFDPVVEGETDARQRVLTDPRPPYGRIGLTMHRE